MYRGSAFLMALLLVGGCGGGENTGGPGNTPPGANVPTNNAAPPANDPVDEPEQPKPDPDKWRKITTPAPANWHKLGNEGRAELLSDQSGIFKKPPVELQFIAAHSDLEAPHASSGTNVQWQSWREDVSVVMVYAASKEQKNAVDVLKAEGDKFLEGFDPSAVKSLDGMAVYIHPGSSEKMMAAVSNERGTYIVVGLARSEETANMLKGWPKNIKPE